MSICYDLPFFELYDGYDLAPPAKGSSIAAIFVCSSVVGVADYAPHH